MKEIKITLGAYFSGLSLKAQPCDQNQDPIGSPITTGFKEVYPGSGDYIFKTVNPSNFYLIFNATDEYLWAVSFPEAGETSNFAVTPITTTVSGTTDGDEKHLWVYQHTATALGIACVDKDGDELDLNEHDCRFLIFADFYVTPEEVITIEGDALIVTGNSVTVHLSTDHTSSAGRYRWALRDLTFGTVLGGGTLEIRPLPAGGDIPTITTTTLSRAIRVDVESPHVDDRSIVVYEDTTETLSFTLSVTTEMYLLDESGQPITDEEGNPLSLGGLNTSNILFVAYDDYFSEETVLFTIQSPDITLLDGVVSVPLTETHTENPGKHNYALRIVSAGVALSRGSFEIREMPGGE